MAVVRGNHLESFPGEAGTEASGSVKCMSSRHREAWELGRKDRKITESGGLHQHLLYTIVWNEFPGQEMWPQIKPILENRENRVFWFCQSLSH